MLMRRTNKNFLKMCGGKFNFTYLYKDKNMSKEMREQINRVKNWKQFLNENIKTDDGNTLTLIKVQKDPMAYWVELNDEIIGNVAGIGRFGDWSWSLRTDKVDTTSTFGIFKNKEDASNKVYLEYLKVCG